MDGFPNTYKIFLKRCFPLASHLLFPNLFFDMATQDSGPAEMTGQEVLDCCAKGDLDLLTKLLAARPQGESNPSSHDMLVAACNAKQPQTVQFLIQQYPTTETSQKLHEAAMAGGIPVYEIILNKYPDLKEHSFGHMCDPIGKAVMDGDLEMLKFLLKQGFDIQRAHFCYCPVCQLPFLRAGPVQNPFDEANSRGGYR